MAILFNAATEHLAVADNAKWTWTPTTQDRTLSIYVKVNTAPSSGAIVTGKQIGRAHV